MTRNQFFRKSIKLRLPLVISLFISSIIFYQLFVYLPFGNDSKQEVKYMFGIYLSLGPIPFLLFKSLQKRNTPLFRDRLIQSLKMVISIVIIILLSFVILGIGLFHRDSLKKAKIIYHTSETSAISN